MARRLGGTSFTPCTACTSLTPAAINGPTFTPRKHPANFSLLRISPTGPTPSGPLAQTAAWSVSTSQIRPAERLTRWRSTVRGSEGSLVSAAEALGDYDRGAAPATTASSSPTARSIRFRHADHDAIADNKPPGAILALIPMNSIVAAGHAGAISATLVFLRSVEPLSRRCPTSAGSWVLLGAFRVGDRAPKWLAAVNGEICPTTPCAWSPPRQAKSAQCDRPYRGSSVGGR